MALGCKKGLALVLARTRARLTECQLNGNKHMRRFISPACIIHAEDKALVYARLWLLCCMDIKSIVIFE